MLFSVTEKYLLNRPHLTGEYDVASYFELPAEDLYELRSLPPEELVDSLSRILKNMALYEYHTRIEYVLSKDAKERLDCLVYPPHDFISHTLTPPTSSQRANAWYEHYFMQCLAFMPAVKQDREFALKFEKMLTQIIRLRKRAKKLQKMQNSCFFLSKKKKRAKKLISEIYYSLKSKSVGLYGIIVYAYTLYAERSSNDLFFRWYLGLKSQY